MKLFVSPHNDDAALFAAFTLQREHPTVLTMFDSHVQVQRGHPECSADARRREDIQAMAVLGCTFDCGYVPDHLPRASAAELVRACLMNWDGYADEIWIPAIEAGGHEQHNLVSEIALEVFKGKKISGYLTYTRTGGKSTWGNAVACSGAMVLQKLRALACYRTQLEIDALGCWPHFMDLREYMV